MITILSICSYKLYEKKNMVIPWSQVESVKDYTYIDIYKMSEVVGYIQYVTQEVVWDHKNHIVAVTIDGKLYHSAVNAYINDYGICYNLGITGITLNK